MFVPKWCVPFPAHGRDPELAKARIVLDQISYTSERFEETQWGHSSTIVANGWARGMVQVFYTDPGEPAPQGLFRPEERHLLDSVARTLGEALQRRDAEAELEARSMSPRAGSATVSKPSCAAWAKAWSSRTATTACC